jgi:hypothetical protein
MNFFPNPSCLSLHPDQLYVAIGTHFGEI